MRLKKDAHHSPARKGGVGGIEILLDNSHHPYNRTFSYIVNGSSQKQHV